MEIIIHLDNLNNLVNSINLIFMRYLFGFLYKDHHHLKLDG